MKAREKIKVGFCIAYDWHLLAHSLPPIYEHADVICLSVDKDRISWSGNPFSWDEQGFRSLMQSLDPDGKIQVLEQDYHLPELAPMANEVRQRNMIAEHLGPGGWHIQLDTDEFFLDFKGFTDYLQALNPSRVVNVVCPWITLYKQTEEGFFYVDTEEFAHIEFIQIATKWPAYEYGRRNGNFNIYTDFALLHMSWARPEAEIWEKLNNWGHRNDFDIDQYFRQWKELSRANYHTYKNFNHLKPEGWPKLGFVPARSIEELLHTAGEAIKLPIQPRELKRLNNIWWSRLKAAAAKLRP